MIKKVCYRRLLTVFLLFLTSQSFAITKQQLFYRNFWQPYYHGHRLNYCTLDGKGCGLKVASEYCRIMGYVRADQQMIANNVGLTAYIGSLATCQGWRCNGFKTIRCIGNIKHSAQQTYHYRYRRFVYPRYNHYRVAWCYDGKRYCGRKAAYSFCRRMGYSDTRHFTEQKQVPATQAISNQKLCFGQECNAFREITCYR